MFGSNVAEELGLFISKPTFVKFNLKKVGECPISQDEEPETEMEEDNLKSQGPILVNYQLRKFNYTGGEKGQCLSISSQPLKNGHVTWNIVKHQK